MIEEDSSLPEIRNVFESLTHLQDGGGPAAYIASKATNHAGDGIHQICHLRNGRESVQPLSRFFKTTLFGMNAISSISRRSDPPLILWITNLLESPVEDVVPFGAFT